MVTLNNRSFTREFMNLKCKSYFWGSLLLAALSGCSFHPARSVLVSSIKTEAKEAPPLNISRLAAYEDNGILCVEGTVESADGEHSHERGSVLVTAYSNQSKILEEIVDCFYSTTKRQGSRYKREHEHYARRFDVHLGTEISKVSRITVEPKVSSVPCLVQ